MANDFSEQDLRGANFYHAHLDAANFRGANLKAVPDLSAIRTDDGLIRADFTEATCRAADFSDAPATSSLTSVSSHIIGVASSRAAVMRRDSA